MHLAKLIPAQWSPCRSPGHLEQLWGAETHCLPLVFSSLVLGAGAQFGTRFCRQCTPCLTQSSHPGLWWHLRWVCVLSILSSCSILCPSCVLTSLSSACLLSSSLCPALSLSISVSHCLPISSLFLFPSPVLIFL